MGISGTEGRRSTTAIGTVNTVMVLFEVATKEGKLQFFRNIAAVRL